MLFFIIVPAKPTNLRVTDASGLKVTVAWDEPLTTVTGIPDASSLYYTISYRNLESSSTRQIRSSKNKQSAELTLVGNSRYEIMVRAYKTFNALVHGPWSETLSLKTNESGEYRGLRPYLFSPSQEFSRGYRQFWIGVCHEGFSKPDPIRNPT